MKGMFYLRMNELCLIHNDVQKYWDLAVKFVYPYVTVLGFTNSYKKTYSGDKPKKRDK